MSLEPQDKENRPQSVEIEATEELSEGQNFYDQEPFSTAISKTAEQTETDPIKLRQILTTFGIKQFSDYKDIPSDSGITDILTNAKYNPEYTRQLSKYFEPGQREEYIKAVALMASLLSPYPNWYPYIRTIERAYYNQDGSYKENAPRFVPPKSYPQWLSAQSKTPTPGVSFGIEEIFPQDFAKESPVISPSPASAAGKKPLHHVYRIQRQMK